MNEPAETLAIFLGDAEDAAYTTTRKQFTVAVIMQTETLWLEVDLDQDELTMFTTPHGPDEEAA